ncbi:MAG: tRNA 2-thiouridine(34) synthase MnmA [Desulfobacteraceae bacterium]|nr:tRNA 2-thiouridine(34) synthase MnmA [Desulfobacteraceae bacterium]
MTAAVALSGGIDSLVAAWFLKKSDIPVIGIHFITGYESAKYGYGNKEQGRNAWGEEKDSDHPVRRLADKLDIPLYIADCRSVFENRIVEYFVKTYCSGKTPNPCILCNRIIKFGKALEYAEKLGAEFLATGHYAIVGNTGKVPLLRKGADRKKDQSYFLAMLTPEQLSRANFPLGDLSKDRVRRIALENGLKPVSGRESQDICFIHNENYAGFLENRGDIMLAPGPIVDVDGNTIGTHKGLHRYTVGQRRGISCPASEPYYVVRIKPESNQLIVGFKNNLYKKNCYISGVNWLIPKPDKPLRVKVKIRYRHREADAYIEPGPENTAVIRFAEPQAAITPGQAAVCYTDDAVAAGGWIEEEAMSAS